MESIEKALWFIEGHFAREISLDEVADVAGVSRTHMSRSFSAATGMTLAAYLRGRRLSDAAKALAAGAPDILAVAIGAGYGSHEAFTRAFRDLFGVTPEQVRRARSLANLRLMETLRMDQMKIADLEPPRFEASKPLLIAGLRERYRYDRIMAIPELWQRFGSWLGNVQGQVSALAYGVVTHSADNEAIDYLAGMEVSGSADLPAEFARLAIPAQPYAVFQHRDHVACIKDSVNAIFNRWLPASGREAGEAPDFFERYDERFDPRTGLGGVEIWLPLKA